MSGSQLAASFTGGSGVSVSSVSVTNATTLSLNVTVAGSATVGAYALNLTNGDGGPASKAGALTVDAAPTVGSLSPAAFGQGASSQTVTVTGTGSAPGRSFRPTFSGGSGVSVNSLSVTSATAISLNVTVAGSASVGAYALSLTNGDGGPVTASGALTVDGAPTVGSLSPSALGQGATSVTVTVSGTGFVSGRSLRRALPAGLA